MPAPAPSFADLVDLGKAEALARRPDLAFLDGDVTEAQLHAAAAMSDKSIEVGAQLFLDTFFDGAAGDALTALVDDRCNIQRKGATNAQVTAILTRSSSGASGTIPAGTRLGTATNPDGSQVIFLTDVDVVVGTGINGPFTVAATAQDAGPEGNVVSGQGIETILDAVFDTTFAAGQSGDAAGGNLEESDPELRQRARLWFITLRRGTKDALEFGALLISTVRTARVIEDPDTFQVAVVVTDADGGSTLMMVSDVEAELENWRCAGAPVVVFGGNKVLVSLTVQLKEVVDGFDWSAAATAVADAIEAKINARKGGQTVFLDSLVAAAISVAPDDIEDVAFSAILVDGIDWLAGDIVPADQNTTFRADVITVVGPEG